jgi:hypothetical protein
MLCDFWANKKPGRAKGWHSLLGGLMGSWPVDALRRWCFCKFLLVVANMEHKNLMRKDFERILGGREKLVGRALGGTKTTQTNSGQTFCALFFHQSVMAIPRPIKITTIKNVSTGFRFIQRGSKKSNGIIPIQFAPESAVSHYGLPFESSPDRVRF